MSNEDIITLFRAIDLAQVMAKRSILFVTQPSIPQPNAMYLSHLSKTPTSYHINDLNRGQKNPS